MDAQPPGGMKKEFMSAVRPRLPAPPAPRSRFRRPSTDATSTPKDRP